MSIRAMNWAMEQRTGTPSAQCVLYVVADCADENGLRAFPSLDYIAKRSQQSRATVQRRLRDLEGLGAMTRIKRFDENGRRTSDEIRLHLDRVIIVETEDRDAPDEVDEPTASTPEVVAEENADTIEGSQIDTPGYHPCDGGGLQSCNPMNPPKNPDSFPPKGGFPTEPPQKQGARQEDVRKVEASFAPNAEIEKAVDEFKAGYPDGVVDLGRLREELAKLPAADQRAAVTALPTYAARCKRRKEKSVKAHLFVAKRMFDGLGSTDAGYVFVPEHTDDFIRWRCVYRWNGERDLPGFKRSAHAGVKGGWFRVMSPFVGELPPPEQQRFIPKLDYRRMARWNAWLTEMTGSAMRNWQRHTIDGVMTEGLWLPADWPPRKDGTFGPDATGPPDTLMTAEDNEEFTQRL
jgi:hypothetical protein